MTNQKYLIEHLLRLNLMIKLFQYSAISKMVYDSCKLFTEVLPIIIDDIVIEHQIKVNTLLSFQIGEVISMDNDTLSTILTSSSKYISEHSEGVNIQPLMIQLSKLIYNIKFFS